MLHDQVIEVSRHEFFCSNSANELCIRILFGIIGVKVFFILF
jgi:hypothetical protein